MGLARIPVSFALTSLALATFTLASCTMPPADPASATTSAGVFASPKTATFGAWGVDLTALDKSVEPGDDFFRYVNGGWLDSHEIPPERSSYGVGLVVHERAQQRVREIIEELGARSGAKGTPQQKVGDYYASWMTAQVINERGITPLEDDLERVRAIADLPALTAEFGRAHFVSGSSPIYQGVGINPDNPDEYNLNIGLGGMGLPDRDYYLEDSERFREVREAYRDHIATMLEFAAAPHATASAAAILALETRIATYQWERAERRDRDKTFNPTTVAVLRNNHPGFDWNQFFETAGIQNQQDVNLSHPDTIAPLIQLIRETPLSVWRDYLSYHLISNNAELLSEEIDDANFEFYGNVLNGQQQQLARWKRGVSRVGSKEGLGDALGQIYVGRYFPESSKHKMEELVENLRRAYRQRIDTLNWMSPATKKEARKKLAAFRAKIGYPDDWLDLSPIVIDKADLFGNDRRIRRFFEEYDIARLGRPTDREEWFMTPQTVNAYYLSNFNEIVFPAAILEPPYFDPAADDAVNYGAIGAIIGHEMGHGFDDQGAKSDARGIKRDWWTGADKAAFEQRTARLVEQYSRYEPVPGHFLDGEFTLGENIGDLGGIAVALHAYQISLDNRDAPVIDGWTGEQRFFLGFAQVWRTKIREQAALQYLKADPHSPPEFRVNGVVRNLEAWYPAFGVTPTNELYLAPAARVSIW